MKLFLDFMVILGIVICSIILILLYKQKNKFLPQYLLTFFFIVLLSVCINTYASLHEIIWLFIPSFLVSEGSVWFLAPLLYLYVKSLFFNKPNFIHSHKWHFIPFLVYFLGLVIPAFIYFLTRIKIFKYLDLLNEQVESIQIIASDIYIMVYIFLSLRIMNNFQKVAKQNFSNLSNHDLRWIKKMIWGSLIVILIDLVTELLFVFSPDLLPGVDRSGGDFVVIALIIMIVYLGYYGVNQSRILLPDFLSESLLDDSTIEEVKKTSISTKSVFSDIETQELELKIKEALEIDKVFLDEDLTLGKLATKVGTTDKKLSSFINSQLETNFYDLINRERVNLVKDKLQSHLHQEYTLLAIAYESGFKSKTSFNRIFKKETGLSPSAYRKIQIKG